MIQPDVSIIIPVYNTADYVRESVLSIMNQKLPNTEIIIINDGSTDQSLDILERLAEQDQRVRIFSQENQGLSSARNAGMAHCSGKYVYFMDSDDLLESDALLLCFEKSEKEKLDFLFFDAESFGPKELLGGHFNYDRAKLVQDRIYQGAEILELLLDRKIYRASVCLNFINHAFLTNTGLTFSPGIIHEDELFTGLMYLKAERVGCIKRDFFKRRVRQGSIMAGKYAFRNIMSYMTVAAGLDAGSDDTPRNRQVTVKLLRYILNPSIYNAHVLPFRERMKVFEICLQKSYLKYVTLKNMAVLFFPFLIASKQIIKRKLNGFS